MKAKRRFAGYFLIFLIGFGKFIPVFYAPDFLRDFYSSVLSDLLHIPLLGLIFYLLYKAFKFKINKKEVTGVAVFYILLLIFTPIIREGCNKLTISVNKDRSVANFINPILGMTMDKKLSIDMVYYKYNKGFLVYEALVYKEDHRLLEIPEIEKEASIKRIYDKDWYLYFHFD